MPSFTFTPAVKTGSTAKIAISGPPGSGKTYTALKFATALAGGKPIGVVDTERHRARKYADEFQFGHLPLEHFDPRDLIQITIDAARQGVRVLVVDSFSPFWTGADGMLDQVGRAQRDFEGWKIMRPIERQMLDALLGFPGHVIATMRVKMAYDIQRGDDGKIKPVKLGLKPEQRDGISYEFDFAADMAQDGFTITFDKSMCREIPPGWSTSRPDESVANTIDAWLRRDAIGEPLNPHTVADWALEDDRTVDDLRARWAELEAVGQLSAVVAHPFVESEFIAVGDLLRKRRQQIQNEQQRAERLATAA